MLLLLSFYIILFQVDVAGTLGAFPLLYYFISFEIKNTGLMQFVWSLRAILTGILCGMYVDAT